MDFERSRESKKFGEGRKKLLALEQEGKYVFHGSHDAIDVLEPRQAYNDNPETGEKEEDGDPAVFATPYADVAIFRALISGKDVPADSESTFGMNERGLHFSATQNLIDNAKGRIAKVYVLDRTKFSQFEGSQCRSTEPITPVQVVEVMLEDLPDNITVIQ